MLQTPLSRNSLLSWKRSIEQETIRRSTKPDWEKWLLLTFSDFFRGRNGELIPLADFHREMWKWVWSIQPGRRQEPLIGVWSRHGGKSTNAELACVAVGAKRTRNYVLYVCGTQSQADDHVSNIAGMLESPILAQICPDLCKRAVGAYQYSKGWRRNRLRTASGLTIDALGLDTAARGAKIDEDRPDLIILDDIDDETDTIYMVEKKLKMISRKVLQAGANHLAVLAIQNLIHPESVFSRLVDGRADILKTATLSGPYPALKNLTYEEEDGRVKLTGGEPTWQGLDLARCQEIVDDTGLDSFLVEMQHERRLKEGGIVGDIWSDSVHIIEPFDIPEGWYVDRAYDHGTSKPYAVLYFAQSDGETPAYIDGNYRLYPRGSLFVIAEIYGWDGRPNSGCRMTSANIAAKIRETEKNVLPFGDRVRPGPADNQIENVTDGESIAAVMRRAGIRWTRSNKGPGSRVARADRVRTMLKAAATGDTDVPHLYFFSTCAHCIRTIPVLPRDPRDPDDADTEAEDHCWDALGYRCLSYGMGAHQREVLAV